MFLSLSLSLSFCRLNTTIVSHSTRACMKTKQSREASHREDRNMASLSLRFRPMHQKAAGGFLHLTWGPFFGLVAQNNQAKAFRLDAAHGELEHPPGNCKVKPKQELGSGGFLKAFLHTWMHVSEGSWSLDFWRGFFWRLTNKARTPCFSMATGPLSLRCPAEHL